MISYGTNDRAIIDPKTRPGFRMASGLGVDDRRSYRRFRANHHARAAPAYKRLVRTLLGYLSVSIDSVAAKKKSGYHLVGLDSFSHRLSHYHARTAGLDDEGRGTFLIDLSRCWKEGCF